MEGDPFRGGEIILLFRAHIMTFFHLYQLNYDLTLKESVLVKSTYTQKQVSLFSFRFSSFLFPFRMSDCNPSDLNK